MILFEFLRSGKLLARKIYFYGTKLLITFEEIILVSYCMIKNKTKTECVRVNVY